MAAGERVKKLADRLAFQFLTLPHSATDVMPTGGIVAEISQPTTSHFIRRLIAEHPASSRRRLSEKLCEAWQWKQANGALRDMVCRGLLLMLASRRARSSLPRDSLQTSQSHSLGAKRPRRCSST